jgi:hypothetical protein
MSNGSQKATIVIQWKPKGHHNYLMAIKLIYLALVAMDAFFLISCIFSIVLKGGDFSSKFGKWPKYVKITHKNV